MTAVFVSDLHLHAERPAQTQAFVELLGAVAPRGDRLYILGDLFEYWLGDDDDMPPHPEVCDALAEFTAAGGEALFMHGNRDFLVADAFCQRTGCALIGDPCRTELDGDAALLMHGDLLCTRDLDYQKLRRTVRDPGWQQAMLARPLAERRALARQLRDDSESAIAGKSDAIMDVDEDTVADYLRRHDCRLLVHGHTHRPADHHFELDGEPARRVVLADWYQTDEVLLWERGAARRLRVSEYAGGA